MSVKTSKSKSKEPRKSASQKSGEPQTMEELLVAYGGNLKNYTINDHVTGIVKSIDKKGKRVVIDIGGKNEGLVAEKSYKESEKFINTLKVGDEVEGIVIVSQTPEGYTVLTLRPSAQKKVWEKVEKSYDDDLPIEVEAKSLNNAGVIVQVGALTGFIPSSQFGKEAAEKLKDIVGEKFEAQVIDFDKTIGKVILSEKEVSEKEQMENARKALDFIKEDEEFEGEVTTIYDFGCFVQIKAPIAKGKKNVPLEGLVHISEMSWDKVDNPEDVVKVGEKVSVKVIGKKKGKLALSMKQRKTDPWDEISKKFKKEDRLTGKVMKMTDFGVFVQLEPGVEGLIHVTKIPPGKSFAKGEEAEVYIEEIDEKEKKISLGPVLTAKPIGYK